MMSNAKLQAAKELIRENNYSAARNILEAMPGNAKAQAWLKKLNDRYPAKRQRAPVVMAAIIIILLSSLAALLVSTIILFAQNVEYQQIEEARLKHIEPGILLVVDSSCDTWSFVPTNCTSWFSREVSDNPKTVDEIVYCIFVPDRSDQNGLRNLYNCLEGRGIIVPTQLILELK